MSWYVLLLDRSLTLEHKVVREPGRTSRRRLAAVLVGACFVAALLMQGVAQGALPIALASKAPITVHIDHLTSTGLGIELVVPQGDQVGLAARLPAADLVGLCQSSTVTLPGIGPVTTVLRAKKVHTTDLVIDIRGLRGDVDLAQLAIGPAALGVGYRSGLVRLDDVTIDSGSIAAGTFAISDIDLGYHRGVDGCG